MPSRPASNSTIGDRFVLWLVRHMLIPTGSSPRFAILVLTVSMTAATGLGAQQRTVFRSGVEMVPLTVTVTDGRGHYVPNLAGGDFTVFEDGIQQELSFFASEHVAVDLALVVDLSSSMRANLPLVQKAARGLVRSLRPGDRATVVALTGGIDIPQAPTADHAQVDAALQALKASGETAFYDGLYVVLKELARARPGTMEIRKQALVVLSDGLDTASRLGFEDVRDLAGRVGINIYTIAMPGLATPVARRSQDARILQAEYAMKSLARESGGLSFFPRSVDALTGIYSEIGTELANQYELGYLPSRTTTDRGFRRVTVRVENAVARTRAGYHAGAARAAAAPAIGRSLSAVIDEPRR